MTMSDFTDFQKETMFTLPVERHSDAAGSLSITLRGGSDKALLIGGHIDPVINGG